VIRLLILLLLSACSPKTPPPPKAVPVKVVTVERLAIPADFQYVGVAESSHIVQIRARVEGYLEEIDYVEGSLVNKDDLLFVLDERPLIADVERANAYLEQRTALWWNAEQTKKRMVPLYEQNAVSQRDYDQAIANELAARADWESAQAELYKAEVNLSYARIRAPVTALSSRALLRPGALIVANENLLTTLYVVDPIWVNFNISDLDYLKGQKEVKDHFLEWPADKKFTVEAILADGTVLPAGGTIDFLNPAIQQDTGTLFVRSVFPNPDHRLFPGQFVQVIVKGALYPDAIAVPQTAVVQGQNGMFVFVVQDGKAVVRPIEAGDWYKDSWIIHKGLEAGDVVVIEGVNKLRNGTPVTPL